MVNLQNTAVLVLGLGNSGLAMARWCARAGARVTVADTRAQPPNLGILRTDLPDILFVPGPFSEELVTGKDIRAVFISPGLSPSEAAPVFMAAKAMNIKASGELGLFIEALADLEKSQNYAPKILAITGTNGKTTVTSLTGKLVERAGKKVAVAGNIGPSLLDTLNRCLQEDSLPDVWVLELSSFQLHGVDNFEPTLGVVLNISQDHLDWHGSIQNYIKAKAHIFGTRAPMLLNREDQMVMQMLPPLVKGKQLRSYITFGTDIPQRPGDYGLETVNGMTWLVKALEVDETRKRRKDDVEEIHIQRLIPADALRIRGTHNAANALAALALASAVDCPLGPTLYGLREYRGEPHRVEPVAIVHEVEYFDDSKGTNVGATVAALAGLGVDRRLVVILGGEGKGQDFSPLAAAVQRYARAVVLIGRDADAIAVAIQSTTVPVRRAESMQQAVSIAQSCALAGDAVLLSPACASFDMFDNYEHRAKVFRDIVTTRATDSGQVLGVAT